MMSYIFTCSLFILLFIFSNFIHGSSGIKCYLGLGATSGDSIIDNCNGNCFKVIQQTEVNRGCSNVKGATVCDSALGVTACYCNTDLCNGVSTIYSNGLFIAMSTLAVFLLRKWF